MHVPIEPSGPDVIVQPASEDELDGSDPDGCGAVGSARPLGWSQLSCGPAPNANASDICDGHACLPHSYGQMIAFL